MQNVEKNYNELKEIFDSIDIGYNEDNQEFAFEVPFEFEEFIANLKFWVDDESCLLDTRFPINISKEKRVEVAIYFTLVNLRIKLGKFVINMDSGEAGFRIDELFQLTDGKVERIIGLTLNMIETQFPKVLSIVYGDKDPYSIANEFFSDLYSEETVEIGI